MITALEIMDMLKRCERNSHEYNRRVDAAIMGYIGQIPKPVAKFTSSVDAINSVTPYGYRPCFVKSEFDENAGLLLWQYEYFDYNKGASWFQTQSVKLCTEAVARCHAVVQCIERERILVEQRRKVL